MYNIFLYSFRIIEISLFGYFFYISVYNFVLSLAGLFYKVRRTKYTGFSNRIVVFIPAYKEDNVIISTAKGALKMNYPTERFDVVVIADSLKPETILKLKKIPIQLLEVSFSQSTKVKSIQKALIFRENQYDFFIILDADNVMKHDFLSIANELFNKGEKIVQGRRIAKNQENSISLLDDLSEQINNHINRKGNRLIGGSSSIAGSGFFIDMEIGSKIFNQLNSIGGFDKELELKLLSQNIKTNYNESMIVFDEKVGSTRTFKNQRRRWIASQYFYFFKYFKTGFNQLFIHGNFAYFNSAILRNFQLPRLLNLFFFSFVILLVLLFFDRLFVPYKVWVIIYSLFLSSILFAIPRSHFNKKTLRSLLTIPEIFFTMFLIMFRLKRSNKTFSHTPHNIDSLPENE